MKIGMKTRHEKEQDMLGMRRPRWDRRVSGHLVIIFL